MSWFWGVHGLVADWSAFEHWDWGSLTKVETVEINELSGQVHCPSAHFLHSLICYMPGLLSTLSSRPRCSLFNLHKSRREVWQCTHKPSSLRQVDNVYASFFVTTSTRLPPLHESSLSDA